jgi:type III restriction enzyme
MEYLKLIGNIGFYHPNWVAVQMAKAGEVDWIVKTKRRVWEGTTAENDALNTCVSGYCAATKAVRRFGSSIVD